MLLLFIQHGSYSVCIYQPKINHRQLDITNYLKESVKHSVTLLDTAMGKNDFGFDKQSLIKIMPHTIKKELNGKRHPCSLQSFCEVTHNMNGVDYTKYMLLADYIASDLKKGAFFKTSTSVWF